MFKLPHAVIVAAVLPLSGCEIAYYTTLYNATNVPITLKTDRDKNARSLFLAPGDHITYRGGLSTTGFLIETPKRRFQYRYPITKAFATDYTTLYHGHPNYVHVVRADFHIYRATQDGTIDPRAHPGFPLVPLRQQALGRTSNQMMELTASGRTILLSVASFSYPVAMHPVARGSSSCSR